MSPIVAPQLYGLQPSLQLTFIPQLRIDLKHEGVELGEFVRMVCQESSSNAAAVTTTYTAQRQ